MEFNLKINVDNDAYRSQAVQHQLIDNLNEIIAKLEDSWDYGTVKDVNGNAVGEWSLDV
jgi:hypothetical protein